MIEDAELLRRYVTEHSESAFAEFVQRRIDFVYACALRRVGGDAHFADDVAQQVFVAAAREARHLAGHPGLTGWLYTTTRNVAAQLVRTERRRQVHEEQAFVMENYDARPETPVDWEKLRPVLDSALDGLSAADREAVLLRYFEGRSFVEIGSRLRLAENSARMRVDRALDKLSAALTKRGVTSTVAALAIALAGQPGVAAPTGLAAAATGAALAGAGLTGSAITTAFFMGMTKLQMAAAGIALAAGATGLVVQARSVAALQDQIAQVEQQAQAGTVLEAERAKLIRLQQEMANRERAQAGELAELTQETASLNAQLTTVTSVGPSTPARSTQAFDIRSLDVQPVARVRTPPQYPVGLREAGTEGEATVDFDIDPDGKVQNVTVKSATHPEFGEAAVAAVQQWLYRPGQKGGTMVATHVQMPIVFTLNNESSSSSKPKAATVPWF